MIKQENKYTNISGVFPDALIIDASGAGLTDGSEYAASQLNDNWDPFQQSIMDYANGGINAPTGTPGTPNGVADAKGVNQVIEAIQVSHGIGPGKYVQWGLIDNPSVTGDRVLLLTRQGVLISVYPGLTAACYVGDPNNATAPYFYKASDAAGTTRTTAGTYLILPPARYIHKKQYEIGNTYNGVALTVTGAGWTTTNGIFLPYSVVDEAGTGISYRLRFNIGGTVTSASRSNYTATISGVTFKTVTAGFQTIAAFTNDSVSGAVHRGSADSGAGTVSCRHATITTVGYYFSGDVELDSAPTWADDFDYPLGITY